MRKAKIRTLCILLGVLLLVCCATFAASRYEAKKEEIRNSDEIILSISPDTASALSWEYEDTSLSFYREEDGDSWVWEEDSAFPVDGSVIRDLLSDFENFGVSFIIENVTDFSQYGLDEPDAVIRISAGDTDYEIKLGTYSTMDEERYVSIGDGNVYLAAHDPMEDYELTIRDCILHDSIPDVANATSIVFSGAEAYEITYLEDSDLSWCAEDVYFTDNKPLNTASVSSYLRSIHNLSLTDYVSYNASEEELAAYGLDSPELTVSVTYPESGEEDEKPHDEQLILHIGRNQEELADALASEESTADTDDVTAYARVGDSQIIYQITNSEYKKLAAAAYNDLRHEEIVTASFDDVKQIDITLEGETYTMTAEAGEEDSVTWHYADTEDFSIMDIENAILALSASDFTEEPSGGKEEIRFTLSLENETHPEITVVLYRCDGSNCVAEINGETTAFVPRSEVVDLIEAVHAAVLN